MAVRLFLLSSKEVRMMPPEKRIARYMGESFDWWLRTPGIDEDKVACVRYDGTLDETGNRVNSLSSGIRPAIYLPKHIIALSEQNGVIAFGTDPVTKTPCQWTYLTEKSGYGLLVSENILSMHLFNQEGKGNQFFQSDIATYMEEELLSMMFSKEEVGLIAKVSP